MITEFFPPVTKQSDKFSLRRESPIAAPPGGPRRALILTPLSSVQVVSMGLYLGEKAYLRSSWNILDGFLVFVSLIDIVVSMAGGAKILGVLRVLRLLRTLRPLRLGGELLCLCFGSLFAFLPSSTLLCLLLSFSPPPSPPLFFALQGDQQGSGTEAGR